MRDVGPPPEVGLPRTLPRVIRYIAPYWRSTTAALVGLVGVAAMTLLGPQLIRLAVDGGIKAQSVDVILAATGGLVLVAVARGLLTFLQTYGAERASQGMAFELRDALFAHIQRLSFAYYDKTQTGQLLTRITSDVEIVRQFAGTGLIQLVSSLALLIGTVTVLFVSNWKLALWAVAPIPVVLFLFRRFLSQAGPLFGNVQQTVGTLNTILQENIAGLRVVRAFAREPVELARFRKVSDDLLRQNLRVNWLVSGNFPTVFFLGSVSTLLVVWVGGVEIINGQLTVGELLAFNTYLAFLLFPILGLGFLAVALARAEASAVRIVEVLDAPIDLADKPGAITLPPIRGRVTFDQVVFRYPGDQRNVLDGISFDVQPGQTVALLGATGSGKTTVVNLIPRFYDVTGGSVKVDGYDVRDVTLASLRSQVGIVLQDTDLARGTIRENIAFGKPDASDDEVRAAAEAAQAAEFIDALPNGYDTVIGDRGVGLSGGQKQRIAIARALLVKPRLLILDDSTSAIDANTEAKIHAALDSIIQSKNQTVFVIAQRISTVRSADLILLLENGRIAARGTHEQLLAESALYHEILGSQLQRERARETNYVA
ncbi:MAG: ABC transporter ATP-binding protein/permease [Dehalococcoidia bacterium]|nr:ABC transporter ATP-binding protein/permease [Dehalococcoidia bacterium]